MNKKLLFVILLLLFPLLPAEGASSGKELDSIYQKASQAIKEGDIEKADFYLARYLGLTMEDEDVSDDYNNLIPLFNQRVIA